MGMKASIKNIVSAYKVLGEAKVTKLEEGEVIKVVKARKAMRPIADDFDAFLKDCQEKFKPENWDEVQEKVTQWQKEGDNTTLAKDERVELNKAIIGYQQKVDGALKDEFAREVEISVEPLKEESATKMLVENGWELKKLDEIELIL